MATKKNKPSSQTTFFILAFIPYLQWIACFIMNGHVRRKRYLIMGFANIMLILVMSFIPTFVDSYVMENHVSYPIAPKESDYWGKTYDDFEIDGEIDWDAYNKANSEWRRSSAYKEYSKALDEYYASDEYNAAASVNERLYSIRNSAEFIIFAFNIILYFTYMVLIFFVERYRYLEALNNKGNSDAKEVINLLNKEQKKTNKTSKTKGTKTADEDIIVHHNKEVSNVSTDIVDGILNVNSATEAEIEALPLVNIVDAKKIISYRSTNGEFKDIDEFFAAFNAKPHVIVKLQDLVTVEQSITLEKQTNNVTKKRFDL